MCCSPGTPLTCIPHRAAKASTSGVQDAVNLGWKLVQVADGASPEQILDTHHDERHPVGARVLRNTMEQVALKDPTTATRLSATP